MLRCVWHAVISLTCTYFSCGISNTNCTALHGRIPQDKRRVLKLYASVVVLWGIGKDGKDKNGASRHTNNFTAFWVVLFCFFLAVVTAGNVCGSCLPPCLAIDVRTRNTVSAVPVERLVSDDTFDSLVLWSNVKKTSVIFYIPFVDD